MRKNMFSPTGEEFSKNVVADKNDRIAHILNMQTQFAAMDAARVRGYIVTVLLDDEDGGGFHSIVTMAGTRMDKLTMLETLTEAMQKGEGEGK